MPLALNPKIWWLELGLNDLGRTQCSEEVVVLGILRVVEEILQQKPDAKIVINSLFPMAQLRDEEDLESSWGPRNKRPNGGFARMKAPDAAMPPNPKEAPVVPPLGDNNNMIKRPVDNGNGNRRGIRGRVLLGIDSSRRGKRSNRPQRGPVKLDPNKQSQHKFNLVTHRENKIPLWTSIMAVNRELQRFCAKHDQVYFHDVTRIFTEQEKKFLTLKTDLITAKGLPTETGYDAWETSIVSRAKFLLMEDSNR
jgi:hypothetical protein